MKQFFDLNIFSRVIVTGIIAIVAIYGFYGLSNMNAAADENQAAKVQELINKTLVQCYALEGSYPPDNSFEEKMEAYGIVLNKERYIYHYEIFSSNIKPNIIVIPRK